MKYGEGELTKLASYLREKSYRNVFLVTGDIVFDVSGAKDYFESINDINFIIHTDFSINPEYNDIVKGIKQFRENQVDAIVALGGGSVIDMAKLINCLSPYSDSEIVDVIQGKIKVEKVSKPLILIPTTSGTGSEATHFAVAYYQGKKYSVASNLILPELAVIDPKLTFSMPPYLTAVTGIDAFAQAVESYWSVGSTNESRSFAKEAIELVWENLRAAVNNNSEQAKIKMALASHLAGKAINISKTTAPHALSYYITSTYKLPHGHAVAVTLPHFVKFNYELNSSDCNDPRGVDFVQSKLDEIFEFIGVKSATEAEKVITEFIKSMGVEIDTAELGIDLDAVYSNVNLERLSNNPRKI
jgi:alcohol dehydrogenase class IV